MKIIIIADKEKGKIVISSAEEETDDEPVTFEEEVRG